MFRIRRARRVNAEPIRRTPARRRQHAYGRFLASAGVVLGVTLAVSACGSSSTGGGGGNANLRIVGVTALSTDPYFVSIKCGAQAAATKLGNVSLSWEGPTTANVSQEVTALNTVATTNPSGVLLGPWDPNALLAPTKSLMSRGIPVWLVDAFLTKNVALHATFTDQTNSANYLAGKIAGLIGGKGVLAVVSDMPGDALETARYTKAVADIRAHYPNITVLPVQYSQADVNTASRVTAGLLSAHPDLSAVYAGDGDTGVGVANAVQVAGKSGKVKVISFDTEPNEVRALQRGTIQALYSQAPYLEGYEAMTGLVHYLRNRGSSTKAVVPTNPYYTPTPLKFITRSTLNTQSAKKFVYRTSC